MANSHVNFVHKVDPNVELILGQWYQFIAGYATVPKEYQLNEQLST